MKEQKQFFTVSEAADLLGVTTTTLRNWDKAGKLKPSRDPINSYRLYRAEDITCLLQERRFGTTISENVLQIPLFNEERAKRSDEEKKEKSITLDLRSLRFLTRQMNAAFRDSMGGGLLERFEEITKILYSKLYMEKIEIDDPKQVSKFSIKDFSSFDDIYEKIKEIYQDAISYFPKELLNGHSSLGEDKIAIAKVCRLLWNIKLSEVEADIKGFMYEELVRNTFEKTDHQQFFTPRTVVEFMVGLVSAMTSSTEDTIYICDPACGSGGFLIETFKSINLNQKIIGFEIDKRMAWVAQMNTIMHGGSINTIHYLNDGGSLGYNDKLNELIPESGFDVVITNPPFGSDFSDETALCTYELGRGKASRRRGVLFIERCIKWLKSGSGRLAIVVDDSILNGKTNHDTRDLIFRYCIIEAVISLPEVTFKPYASVKTSILFLRKRSKSKTEAQPSIFMAEVKEVGRKANGDSNFRHDDKGNLVLNNELPIIINAWNSFKKEGENSIRSLYPKVFVCPAERFYSKSNQLIVDRLDVGYHHPSRSIAERTLKRSKYPTPKLAELVVERNISVVPDKADPYDLWRYIGLADISSRTGEYVVSEVFGNQIKSNVKLFKGGDILFSKLRPELRKCILLEALEEDGYASSECFVFRTISTSSNDNHLKDKISYGALIDQFEVDNEYLAILLRSDIVYGQLVYQISGTGRPRVNRSAVLGARIPLPPLAVQREIVTAHKIAHQSYLESQRRSEDELQRGINFLDSAFSFSSEKLCPSD
ncbi:MAG: N-6 DNA methylase [Pseudanabaena sp. M114S2SP2A07QC]|jgi:type I restriction enzyme M protein|uniref:N-6 DNA methylase n=1 Tax=unclassified Microcystis TaxID=2643300 RepID=UPI002582DD6E|nr:MULTISPECIES: N-6 DNA methylase [unclassified Microcystis]MCA6558017.1 N-6 DNA methylase [Pseudanabaena sp. M114S2SP2A07QC]MCA2666153.1 N-6 DNA methylase [Microcystis sp. M045S2]MCA2712969.1 N-6 DNA methylase [Microcystis sp. M172S2]MCA2836113.1 N-6 DNA methylase [Microcystis sp. M007S1]MCA2838929.1 N-6 DNA methylase [Microcystis sp. M078S1]